jgi:hypothetical protein
MALTKSCTLSINGLGTKTYALIDTRANGFIFISLRLAFLLCEQSNLVSKLLPDPIRVRGYDGRHTNSITEYIKLNLKINGRTQISVPMAITQLGSEHDLILGRMWCDYYDVLVDCRNRRLVWSEDNPPTGKWNRVITIPHRQLLPSPPEEVHQVDTDRRDQLMDTQDPPFRPKAILKRS